MTIKASRQSRKGTVVQQDYHRRSPCGLRHVQSAFRPVVGQRGLIPFVPRAGPLERNLRDQSARDEEINRCSQTLCVSLSTLQNAITTSSCSPAGGLPQPHRNLPAKTHIQLPRCSSKELKENGFQSLCLIPHVSKKIEYEKVADTTPRQVKFLRNCLHTTRRGRSGKRKNPLLPHRRECLILPPPLKLGYRVTAEHLDQEKETVFRRINCALRGKFLISQNSNAVQPFCSPSLPASGTAPPPTVPTVPSKMAGKRKCIVEQDTLGPGALQASAAVTTSMHPGSGRKSTSATCPSSSEALPGSSSHSMAIASDLSLIAAGKDGIRRETPSVPGPSAGEAIPHRKGKRKSNWEPPLYGENPGPLSPRTSERATASTGSSFLAIPKTSKVEPLPPAGASSLVSSQNHCPTADPGVPFFSSLPNTAPAQGDSRSASTSAALATLSVTDVWNTPLKNTSLPRPLLPEPAASCSWSSFPSAQVTMTPSSGSTASAREASTLPALRFFRMATHEKNPIESASSNQLTLGATDGQQHGHTPPPGMLHFGDLKAITLGPTSTSGQLVLSSTTQAAPGGSLHTNMTSGTGASNQMVSSVTQSLSSPGTSIASASATTMGIHDLVQLVSSVIQCLSSSGISIASASPIATHMPNAMTHIQDNRQLQSTLVNRSPDTGTLAVSATPNGSERKELPADFISSFEALTISSTKRGTSSTTRHYGGSMGLSTGGPASHSSLVVSMGPSTMKNSVHGDHRAPVLSSVPTSPLKQKRSNSSGEPSDMTSKAASKCKPKPASKFGIRATHEAKVRRKLVFRATSSSAQASGLTTPAAATESSSCSSEPTVDSKRPKMP